MASGSPGDACARRRRAGKEKGGGRISTVRYADSKRRNGEQRGARGEREVKGKWTKSGSQFANPPHVGLRTPLSCRVGNSRVCICSSI